MVHLCTKVEVELNSTRVQLVRDGQVWTDTKYPGDQLFSQDMAIGTDFVLGSSSFFGVITDVNVWSKSLNLEEMKAFTTSFNVNTQGNIFSWKQLNNTG